MNYAARKAITSLTEGDLRLMRIFRAVASSGGLSAAELTLSMDRSTISRHIKSLESRLGGCLCLRGPAGFELTELGESVLAAAIAACDTLDAVRDDLNRARNILTGDLVVGVADNSIGNPHCRVAQSLATLADEAPAVRVHLLVLPAGDLVRELHARRLNLYVNGTVDNDDDFIQHELCNEEFRLYVGAKEGCVVHLEDLVQGEYAVVIRSGNLQSGRLPDLLGLQRTSLATGLEAAAFLVAGGRHVGYLPEHYVSGLAHKLNLVEVEGANSLRYSVKSYLKYERARPLSGAGRRFRDILLGLHGKL